MRTSRPHIRDCADASSALHYNRAMSLTGVLRYLWNTKTKEPRMLKVGDPAPDFTARDHDGKSVTLSGLRGKKVVLWFYPKADTPG